MWQYQGITAILDGESHAYTGLQCYHSLSDFLEVRES